MINASRWIHVVRCNVADSKRGRFSRAEGAHSRKSAINVRQSRYDYQVAVRRQSIAISSLSLPISFSLAPSPRRRNERQMSRCTYRRVDIHRTITARSSGTQLSPTAGMNLLARRAKRWRIPLTRRRAHISSSTNDRRSI